MPRVRASRRWRFGVRAPVVLRMCELGLVLWLMAVASPVYAMRCEGGLIATGDSPQDVMDQCGAPVSRDIDLPQRRGGHIVEGAVTVERWVYDNGHGARYYLRFVAGKLVDETIELIP